ncbi:hypothetical protein [Tenuibacillus multivorans]|nr:hypothetical protein [Tenuibacillus multivorans]
MRLQQLVLPFVTLEHVTGSIIGFGLDRVLLGAIDLVDDNH